MHFKQNERREKLAYGSQKDFTQNVEKAAKCQSEKKFDEVKKIGAL